MLNHLPEPFTDPLLTHEVSIIAGHDKEEFSLMILLIC